MTQQHERRPKQRASALTHITWETRTVEQMERMLLAAVLATREDGFQRFGKDLPVLEQTLATVTELLDTRAAHGWIMAEVPRETATMLRPIYKAARARLKEA